jgi:hypothetical protein
VEEGANQTSSEYSSCGGMSWGMGHDLGCDGVVWRPTPILTQNHRTSPDHHPPVKSAEV